MKFKINPNTGYVTHSGLLEVTKQKLNSYDPAFHYTNGLYSTFSPNNVVYSGAMFTFGNENSAGNGYGRSKLMWMGFNNQNYTIASATYDIADLVNTISYS